MPSGRAVTVVEYNPARKTYTCLIDTKDIEGHENMSSKYLADARIVEFMPSFLLKHCKET